MTQCGIDALEANALQLTEPRGLLGVVATQPARVLGARKDRGERARPGLADKPIEDGVRVRTRRAVRFTSREAEGLERFLLEEPRRHHDCRNRSTIIR